VFSPLDSRVVKPSATAAATSGEWPQRLRFSRLEADAIAALAPRRTRVWSDFAATRSAALDSTLQEFGILHVAAHAVIDEERSQLSGIVLSQVNRDGVVQDGTVRVHDIYNLSLKARLVVLSACRTALGRPVEGEGLMGLARSYLYAGADAVMATLWDVDDRATAAFMSHFYAALLKGNAAPAEALRRARAALQQDARFALPHYWAGFVMIGRE
jgi:CHAT domain-containing protein